jgi:hypothetical protein
MYVFLQPTLLWKSMPRALIVAKILASRDSASKIETDNGIKLLSIWIKYYLIETDSFAPKNYILYNIK